MTAYDSNNALIADITAWTSYNITPGAGGIWTGNVYTSGNIGSWTVTGKFRGEWDTAKLRVYDPDDVAYIVISPESASIEVSDNQTYTAEAFDAIDTSLGDITPQTTFSIDAAASGNWTDNVYISENPGTWTVTGTYQTLSDNATLTVTTQDNADLAITKIASQAPTSIQELLTYTITVHNNGDDTATGVVVTDNLSMCSKFEAAYPSSGTVNVTSQQLVSLASVNITLDTVTWTIGDLPSGENVTLDIVTSLNPLTWVFGGAGVTNSAAVSGNRTDPVMDNNYVTINTSVITTDLEITKVPSTDNVTMDEEYTWTVTVTNLGPETATDVLVIDLSLLMGVNDITVSQGAVSDTALPWFDNLLGDTLDSIPYAGKFYWNIGDIAAGDNVTMIVTASENITGLLSTAGINLELEDMKYLLYMVGMVTGQNLQIPQINGAVVLSTMPDSSLSNNIAYDMVNTSIDMNETDLTIEKTDNRDPINPGEDITYTLKVTNNGEETATGVMVVDAWDNSRLAYKSADTANGTYSQDIPDWMVRLAALPIIGSSINSTLTSSGQGVLFWTIGDIGPGETVNLTLVMTANPLITMGEVTNSAVILGTYYDTNPTDNIAVETTTIEYADLAIMKAGYPEPVATEGDLIYFIIATNAGPTDASGVVVPTSAG